MTCRALRIGVCIGVVVVAVLAPHGIAAITVEGSFRPDPFDPDGDGVVTGDMELGATFRLTADLTVTDGDTLTTEERSFVGYSVATKANVSITDSTWLAESAVFIAHTAVSEGTVEVTNGTWTVQSNVAIAQGNRSTGKVILNSGYWNTEMGARIADGEDCTGTVTLNGGVWTSGARVVLGGLGFADSNGEGTIAIHTGAEMDSQYGLWVTSLGSVEIDGGTLSLTGENDLEGDFSATANGGTINIGAGVSLAGDCILNVGSGVNLANCNVTIGFLEGFTPEPEALFNLFDPLDDVDLAVALGAADAITTPAGWQLDQATGVMSYASEPVTLTWDGAAPADWTSAHWLPDSVVPTGGEAIVVDSGLAIVSTDLRASPCASLHIAGGSPGGAVDIALTGSLAVTGEVNIGAGGTLSIDGLLAASAVRVTGGVLTSRAQVATARTVDGGLSLGEGSTFVAEIIGAESDQLVVTGAVSIEPNVSLDIPIRGGGDEFQAGTYVLIDADTLTGTFTSVTDLKVYVATRPVGDGLTYGVDGTVTLTLNWNLNPGDGNLDGATDVSDRIIWNNNNFTEGTTFVTGDYNGDGATDVSDRIIWNNNNFTEATAPTTLQAVPEPATMALLALGGMILLRRRSGKA